MTWRRQGGAPAEERARAAVAAVRHSDPRRTRKAAMNDQQFNKMKVGKGFIAALDQSGGSTPKALLLYGIPGECVLGRRRNVRSRAPDAVAHHNQP